MGKDKNYYDQKQTELTLKLRDILSDMPPFSKDYFRAIEPRTSAKTRISYAYDIRVFFRFLIENNPCYKDYMMCDFSLQDLDNMQPVDFEEYMEYLKVYKNDDEFVTNGERGIKRKMSALRSFYNYYFTKQMIQNNPILLVELPKLHDKSIIRLDTDEIAILLDYVENCEEHLSGQALRYYLKTKERDIAILTLLLGTGIRVSELVGLNINDVDFKNNGILVTRKGGNQMTVYFGSEVSDALLNYIKGTRASTDPADGHTDALFLSTQKKRMTVQSVENLVKKYASQATPNKHITPHKLRSTYGTALYKETGDIYLVADVLGHKDVNTTKKHYAAIDDDRRRRAAGVVKLRES